MYSKNTSNTIVKETAEFVTSIFKNDLKGDVYYTYDFVSKVVEVAKKIGKEIKLTDLEQENVLLAAWLLYINYNGKTKATASSFLSSKNYGQSELILSAIDLIRLNKEPESNVEKVLYDAHYFYLSKPNFLKENKLFREEKKSLGENYTDLQWYEKTKKKFVKHRFYTDYGKNEFSKQKEDNYQKVSKFHRKLLKMQDVELEKMLKIDDVELKGLKKKLSKIENRPERGVETLYRLASKNLYTRLTMVDSKGNILISINAIIISITLGSVLARVEEDPHLLIPIIFLLVTNLGSMLFAILATRPPKTKGVFDTKGIAQTSANLLSFDNFFNMNRDDYHENMDYIANNADLLYSNITEDIFAMGKRLGSKYHYLRYSYNIFLYGLMISVGGFLLCHIMFEI